MRLLIKNIKGLVGVYDRAPAVLRGEELSHLPILKNAFLAIEDGIIAAVGSMDDWMGIADWRDLKILDAEGRFVLPGWCDSHTHLVHAGSREREFEDRLHGMSYEQIAARGGGILHSAARLAKVSEEALYLGAKQRLSQAMHMGTVAMEIKSGYGLDTAGELKMLRVIKHLKADSLIPLKATFLGAHAIPAAFRGKKERYLDLLLHEMLPQVAEESLAEYIDVFCEAGYFTVAETLKIVEAGARYGLKAKIHVNQFNVLGAIPHLVEAGALSVDHLEVISEADLAALSGRETIATALPLCSFFLELPYTPARRLLQSDVALAIATDYNPGSAPAYSMPLAISTACIQMKLSPAEAINAATLNGAAAMELAHSHGSITPGKMASILITEPCDSLAYLPYSFGRPAIAQVIINGALLPAPEPVFT